MMGTQSFTFFLHTIQSLDTVNSLTTEKALDLGIREDLHLLIPHFLILDTRSNLIVEGGTPTTRSLRYFAGTCARNPYLVK